MRKEKLAKNPTCENCAKNDRLTLATEIHHIVPVESALSFEEKKRLMYDITNLRSLCHECHLQEHIALGRGGKEAVRKRTRKKVADFARRFLE